MLRRPLSIALILGYIASQLAAVPHAHSGDPLHQQNSSAPHFHLSWFDAGHHDHHSHHHGHHDSHHHDNAAPPIGIHIGQNNTHNHGTDAIYLPIAVAATKSSQQNQPNPAYDEALPVADVATLAPSVIRHSSFDIRHSPPNYSVSHCALYLQLRTLRI